MGSKKKNLCILCQKDVDDEVKYGKLMRKDDISVHYYCLLLSTRLVQKGKDNEGILGFLIRDILKEERRIKSIECKICHRKNAGIICCQSKCRFTFHLSCGIEAGCSNQFFNTFQSFCPKHSNFEKRIKLNPNEICTICQDTLGKYKKSQVFRSPCCKNGWFHRWCLAKMALNFAHFFKCPCCNNKDLFKSYFIRKSIYVPDQDASWEYEPNAFTELLERPNACSAKICVCPKGRKYNRGTSFELGICITCGSLAIHRKCAVNGFPYNCDECLDILKSSDLDLNKAVRNNNEMNENEGINEDEDVDVECTSVFSADTEKNHEEDKDSYNHVMNINNTENNNIEIAKDLTIHTQNSREESSDEEDKCDDNESDSTYSTHSTITFEECSYSVDEDYEPDQDLLSDRTSKDSSDDEYFKPCVSKLRRRNSTRSFEINRRKLITEIRRKRHSDPDYFLSSPSSSTNRSEENFVTSDNVELTKRRRKLQPQISSEQTNNNISRKSLRKQTRKLYYEKCNLLGMEKENKYNLRCRANSFHSFSERTESDYSDFKNIDEEKSRSDGSETFNSWRNSTANRSNINNYSNKRICNRK